MFIGNLVFALTVCLFLVAAVAVPVMQYAASVDSAARDNALRATISVGSFALFIGGIAYASIGDEEGGLSWLRLCLYCAIALLLLSGLLRHAFAERTGDS